MRCWLLAILLNNSVIDRLPNEALEQKSSRTSNRIRIGLEFEFVRIVIFNINSNRIESVKSSIRFDSCGAVSQSTHATWVHTLSKSSIQLVEQTHV